MTCDCLNSIRMQTKDVNYEVIVVDNASTDDSVSYIKSYFEWVRVIVSDQNLGFGKANNRGALEARGKYLFFLNSDTLLLNNAIHSFFSYMERDKEAGAIGGILLNEQGQVSFSYNRFPSPQTELKYVLNKMFRRPTIPLPSSQPVSVDFISGADLFLSRATFERLNGFDPVFFMYYEEVDLQKRMDSFGWKRIILPEVRIIHLEGGSFASKKLTFSRFLIAQKSFNHYITKHYRGGAKLGFRIVMGGLRLTLFFNRWTWKEKCVAYLHVWK
ncbi:MAG: glycosyltransferase family 2 protein [Tannerella sp.]|nr:glycosyltransferase family 2 protein [Tannerella sp.]MDO4702720.1 glycosyltransferase family 2 protein [Tannerella sp.]